MAAPPPSTPVIVGVGETANRSKRVEDAREPLDLMLDAVRKAIGDAGVQEEDIIPLIDTISVVPPWSWPYKDLPSLVASKLGVRNAKNLELGIHGGNQPVMLCDQAARQVASGEGKVAVITGGEALASLAACRKAGETPRGWTAPDPTQSSLDISNLDIRGKNVGTRHGMGLPIHVYPMYENASRAHRKQSYSDNNEESQEMYAAFDRTACSLEYSWRSGQRPKTAKEIGTPTERNRMICTPYPLLMNAFNNINLAAAAIVTTVHHAEALGIPLWERPCYHRSQAIEQSIDAAMRRSGIDKSDIDCYDFYSCFPIVPKLACRHLGLDPVSPSKPISLLGGLTSFGGAGNNYSLHAIAEMTRQIRNGSYKTGLILANGGVLTYQHAICLSSAPRRDSSPYPGGDAQPELVEAGDVPVPVFDELADGEATIEAFTVEFDRKGQPRQALIIGILDGNGHRFLANHGDQLTLRKLCDTNLEPVGMKGTVRTQSDGRNTFVLGPGGKL
ncbi:hypothetical protein GMORB2_0258 [Geosmithia morbida]|uniref:Thiolase-like protein type 1 additional C-terminal domain-containing protein n=1 Tax=Geosmithia morbida TaxID=1094350 RepID=A0A9P4Z1P9_9HYPO|nr:uncharacterized protein GMORB2_0258 [Geosmithia morbida]KAF4126522.1 hypothetical protein GMORB2_0258 [Geosmithia morbida]